MIINIKAKLETDIYFIKVLSIDHNRMEATLELPQDRHSDTKILEIYQVM